MTEELQVNKELTAGEAAGEHFCSKMHLQILSFKGNHTPAIGRILEDNVLGYFIFVTEVVFLSRGRL